MIMTKEWPPRVLTTPFRWYTCLVLLSLAWGMACHPDANPADLELEERLEVADLPGTVAPLPKPASSSVRVPLSRPAAAGTVLPDSVPAEPVTIRFRDGSAASGIDFVQCSGISPEKLYPTANGSGVAMFDYDGDGWLDLYFATTRNLPLSDPTNRGAIASIATAGTAHSRT